MLSFQNLSSELLWLWICAFVSDKKKWTSEKVRQAAKLMCGCVTLNWVVWQFNNNKKEQKKKKIVDRNKMEKSTQHEKNNKKKKKKKLVIERRNKGGNKF